MLASMVVLAVLAVGVYNVASSRGSRSGGAAAISMADPEKTLVGTLAVNDFGLDGCFPGASAAEKVNYIDKMLDGTNYPCPDGPGGGFGDIKDGTQVVVQNDSGQTLAVGGLSHGTTGGDSVNFKIEVLGVPIASPFYKVIIGDRNGQTYSKEELEASDWELSLKLG